jgi:hypothetical protein
LTSGNSSSDVVIVDNPVDEESANIEDATDFKVDLNEEAKE